MIPVIPILMMVLPYVMWQAVSQLTAEDFNSRLTNTNITLVTAHPDDEVMFFGPTMLHLTRTSRNNTVAIVCMSTGSGDGDGEVRSKELRQAAEYLNVTDVTIVDRPDLQDGMDNVWAPEAIHEALEEFVKSSVVITFDDSGVSGHPNHIAVSKGVKQWRDANPALRSAWTLDSVDIVRKYLLYFDELYVHFTTTPSPGTAQFYARQSQFERAKAIMSQAHKSQLKWYRMAWIMLSRYMYVNELTEYAG